MSIPFPGVSANAYLVLDEKTVLLDAVEEAVAVRFQENLEHSLGGRPLDYVVVNHMEPDHSASLAGVLRRWPEARVVGNAKTLTMLAQFTGEDISSRAVVVKEGDTLSSGRHTLTFVMAPMVHWPEVMVTYESVSKTLFSADGFGRFGDTNPDTPWVDEARRYYINIVGKYGVQVQALLKKAAALDVQAVCPLHGPILSGDALALALEKYGVWSSYVPEEKGVLVAYASIHGHTAKAALELADLLRAEGLQVEAIDLTRRDWAEAVAGAFRYSGLVLAAASYDAGVFPPMAQFLARLKSKGLKDRTVGLVENGSWGPTAMRAMLAELEGMKGLTILEPKITIKSAANDGDRAKMKELARALAEAL